MCLTGLCLPNNPFRFFLRCPIIHSSTFWNVQYPSQEFLFHASKLWQSFHNNLERTYAMPFSSYWYRNSVLSNILLPLLEHWQEIFGAFFMKIHFGQVNCCNVQNCWNMDSITSSVQLFHWIIQTLQPLTRSQFSPGFISFGSDWSRVILQLCLKYTMLM